MARARMCVCAHIHAWKSVPPDVTHVKFYQAPPLSRVLLKRPGRLGTRLIIYQA